MIYIGQGLSRLGESLGGFGATCPFSRHLGSNMRDGFRNHPYAVSIPRPGPAVDQGEMVVVAICEKRPSVLDVFGPIADQASGRRNRTSKIPERAGLTLPGDRRRACRRSGASRVVRGCTARPPGG